ncbi:MULTISPECIES: hypothetical protein [Streptococcus]|uniref:hypothetical protein n=1 Tax=Streptococcus TaxID=1301 RepID=UPI000CF59BCD|nr:hypothetical protein [Streptococcus suis]MBM0194705.1 hypothetical protein [Streptococcus suis]MBM7317406.1 hypothetical protein [Streptococcus suis]HEM4696006.1 hypothetical protein [Streptococcus suis]HEM4859931.1 hypothetical protein [Streptococcus suis]HEM4897748.1 hypothetical protein [Streptococcus suis]
MHYLFMDEKGPQNSFKISNPFDKKNKLSYANDNMHSYVANVIQIEKENYKFIEEEYHQIVETYLSTRKQLQQSLRGKNKELKGLDLLKTNFDYGIASMRENEVHFYLSLFKMLDEYNVKNLLFMVSKMSIITSSRLTNFFYFLDEETEFSPFIAKYVLTKYAEIEASKKVIESLLDKKLPIRPLLKLVKEDLNRIINNNQDNMRMARQLDIYQQLIIAMDRVIKNHKVKLVEPDSGLSFDWDKVKWAFDLWITEQRLLDNQIEWMLFLDEGIPSGTFNGLEISRIIEGCDSKDHVGLQITDMIVVLIGKLVSQMTANTRYDFANPDKRVLLNENYFDFNEQQYNLVVELNKFLLNREARYHFVNDAYFDESLLLQVYIGYIASFDNFNQYASVGPREHVDRYFQNFVKQSEEKYSEGTKNELMAKCMFGSLKEGIEDGTVRPL